MKLKNIIPKKLDFIPDGDFWVLKRPNAHTTHGEFYYEQHAGELRTVSYSLQANRFKTLVEAGKYRDYVKVNDRPYLLDFEPPKVTITMRKANANEQEFVIARMGKSDEYEIYACRRNGCSACSNIMKVCGRYCVYGHEEYVRDFGLKTLQEAIDFHDKSVWVF